MAILGIDTSNYRTSICLIDSHFRVLLEENPLLEVGDGELGLQQSAAVFQHLKVWSTLLKRLAQEFEIEAVGVSTKPRPVVDSYMPVFKVGEVLAETIAHFLSVPLFKTSHQEGHIAAGEYSLPIRQQIRPQNSHFIAVHLSGGTSEILSCQRLSEGYQIEKLGGTLDLHVGQFVDRVGVKLGLPFPAGPMLEKLAQQVETFEELPIIPSATKGFDFSFSGPTSAALRLIESGLYPPSAIARAVEKTIAKTLEKSLNRVIKETGLKEILLVGGVASNRYITKRVENKLQHLSTKAQLCFAPPQYATDNAFGVACLALKMFQAKYDVGGI